MYVPYCDGTSLSGNAVVKYNETFTLHFDGRRILDELVDSIERMARDDDFDTNL